MSQGSSHGNLDLESVGVEPLQQDDERRILKSPKDLRTFVKVTLQQTPKSNKRQRLITEPSPIKV